MDKHVHNEENIKDFFKDISKRNLEWFNGLLAQAKTNTSEAPFNTDGVAYVNMFQQFFDNATVYLEAQRKFYESQMNLWQNFFKQNSTDLAASASRLADKRFSDPEWENNLFFSYLKQSYLNMSGYLVDCVSKANMDDETKERLKYFMKQYLDALSPSNFALTNPEVIKAVVETGGLSLVNGMKNMLEDIKKGYIAMTDESSFKVGETLAITKGSVIFKNELIEVIQYAPTTSQAYKKPLLIVPPCINKYYILDLQPENSLVKYLVDQGFTVFMLSWKSADSFMKHLTWSDYINIGVIRAIEVVKSICEVDKVNTLGYCIGGLLLTTAAIILKQRKLDIINSMTHLTTMLDHTDPGDIKFFIDRDLQELNNIKAKSGGIVPGRIISQTFSALRANELIWNYWVNNYLLAKKPEPLDILYWNNDAVDLPLIMHSFLLREFYINNSLVKGEMVVDDVKLDLATIDYPVYIFASQKDHIVPWKSAYNTTQYIKSNVRFVLGSSGHTAGVVSPITTLKRSHWVNDNLVADAKQWEESAVEVKGSWWGDYNEWLSKHSGELTKAPTKLGNSEFKVLYEAPGDYVKARALSLIEAQVI